MKVKIGNNIYDSNEIPIMLILTKEDKKLISSMPVNNYKYCSYPKKDTYTPAIVESFMRADTLKLLETEKIDFLESINKTCRLFMDSKSAPVDILEMNKGTYEFLRSTNKIDFDSTMFLPKKPFIGKLWSAFLVINENLEYMKVVAKEYTHRRKS